MSKIILPRIRVVGPYNVNREPLIRTSLRPHEMVWEIIDKDGNVVRAAESPVHNLVLNKTWDDHIASAGFWGLTAVAVVGTGSSAPDATQINLDSELARTTSVPSGESEGITYVGNGVYEFSRVKQFTSAQVGGNNLTEWGWSPSTTANGGNLTVRELFRDSNGDPITLTLDADQSLRLYYKQQVTISPVPMTAAAASFNLVNVGTFNGNFWLSNKQSKSAIGFVDAAARGAVGGSGTSHEGIALYRKKTNIVATTHTGSDVDYINEILFTFSPYTSGDRHRVIDQQTVGVDEGNDIWYGLVYIYNDYATIFDSDLDGLWFDFNGTFTKDNLHKLIIDSFTVVSWGP